MENGWVKTNITGGIAGTYGISGSWKTMLNIEECRRCHVLHAMRLACPVCGYPYSNQKEGNEAVGDPDAL